MFELDTWPATNNLTTSKSLNWRYSITLVRLTFDWTPTWTPNPSLRPGIRPLWKYKSQFWRCVNTEYITKLTFRSRSVYRGFDLSCSTGCLVGTACRPATGTAQHISVVLRGDDRFDRIFQTPSYQNRDSLCQVLFPKKTRCNSCKAYNPSLQHCQQEKLCHRSISAVCNIPCPDTNPRFDHNYIPCAKHHHSGKLLGFASRPWRIESRIF